MEKKKTASKCFTNKRMVFVPVEIGTSEMEEGQRRKESTKRKRQIGLKRQMVMAKVIEVTKIMWVSMEVF